MAKKLAEITKFMTGTILTPSERDISVDAASDSLNVDPIAQDGVLQGINADKVATDKFSTDLNVNASKFAVYNNSGYKQILFYDPNVNKLRSVNDITTSNPTDTDVSSTAETVTGVPDFEVNNQEVHVGTGNAETNAPLWAGKVTNKQWGSEVTGVQRELAKLKKPGNLPPFDKVIKIGNYFYGAQDQDSKVYAVDTSGEFYDSSFDIFQSIITIAYNNETSFWVLDKISDTTCEIKLVDAGSFEVTQTTSFTGIYALGDDDYDPMLATSQQDLTGNRYSFAKYFNTTGTSPLGGGASFITDMVATNGFLYFLRGSGAQTDKANMVKWRYFFKCIKPTQTGTTTVYDISFRTVHEKTDGSANLPANSDGGFYSSINALNSEDISVVLEIPYKGLINGGVACGIAMNIFPVGSSSNQRVCLYNSFKASVVESGTSHENKAILLGSDVNDSAPHMHIYYFPDDHYMPLTSNNPGNFTALASSNFTFRPLDSFNSISGTNYSGYYIRKLSSNGGSQLENLLGIPDIAAISQFNASDSNASLSLVRYTNLSDNTTDVYYTTGSSYSVCFYVATYSGLSSVSTFLATQVSTIASNTNFEMQAAFPITIKESSVIKSHLFRTAKNLTVKKFQYIKINANDGVVNYAKETDISIGFTETGLDASWNSSDNASKIFYKFSITYDGFQESPLGNAFIYNLSSSAQKRLRLNISLHNIDQLSKRATHLNVYCAVSSETTSTAPDGFYRLVKSLRLDTGWTDSVNDQDNTVLPAWSVTKSREFLHNGSVSISYEARVGINEVIDDTLPNYSISTSLNNHLFIANCYHSQIDNAKNYLFKSRPYNYSQFDWSKDFLILPTIPTTLQSFMGRLYAFNEDNMYRIEPNNLFIEDILEGTGCINQQTIAVSDYGMCFCDDDNIYLHDGRKANPIGDKILRNNVNAWELKTAVKAVVFDTFRKAFIIFFVNANGANRAWVYSVLRNRWDLWESNAVTAAVSKPHNTVSFLSNHSSASCLYSDGSKLITYLGDSSSNRPWSFTTKKLTMGQDTNNKKFYKIKLIGTPSGNLNETGVATVDSLTPTISGANSFTHSATWDGSANFNHGGNSNITVGKIITGDNIPANSKVSVAQTNYFRINTSMSGIDSFTSTFSFSDPWQINQNYTNITQTSTSGSGSGIKCSITTNTDGNPTFTITDSGTGYAIDDQILFTDPGNTTGTAILVVASLAEGSGVYAKIDNNSFVQTGSTSESKIPGSNGKGKSLQVYLANQTGTVDSIGIIYRHLKVK
tara:strand:- start:2133 stop:5945 length:3813 start_codon:yes stop_codon:yes gene_type:complete